MSQPPSVQSVAEMRTKSGMPSGKTLRDGIHNLDQEPDAILEAAAILVSAFVGERRKELVDEVTVRCVQLDHVEAGDDCAACGSGKGRSGFP